MEGGFSNPPRVFVVTDMYQIKSQELTTRAKSQTPRAKRRVKPHTTLLLDLLITMGLFVTLGLGANLASPKEIQAGPPQEKQVQQAHRENPNKSESPCGTSPTKKKDKSEKAKAPAHHPALKTEHAAPNTHGTASSAQQSGSRTKQTAPSAKRSTQSTHDSTPNSQHPAPGTQPQPQPQHPPLNTQHPAPSSKSKVPGKPAGKPAPATVAPYHGTFVEALPNAPFPHSGKDVDPNFFDFADPRTGERFRTTRTWERLSEKEHYRDSSVLFHVPSQFNPNKPFSYVVFFHGNRSDVRQSLKEYRLDEQIENSGKNVVLLLPQLAKNASDSSPGKFSRKDVFRAFMQEAAQALSQKVGKKHRRQLEQAPIILVAFSGGYKPLACALDRGGAASRIRGVLLLDALYEDLYIFGKWLLNPAGGSFFINIYTDGSSCEEKTKSLAQFLCEHHVPFKEEWPKAFTKQQICLIRSSSDHLQVPLEGPPRDPLTAVLRSLKF